MSPKVLLPEESNEERLRLLTDNLPHSYLYQYLYLPDGEREFIYISTGVFAVHGLQPEQIMADSKLLPSLVDPAFVPDLLKNQETCREKLCDFRMELRVRHVNGEWRWIELRSRPRKTASGLIIWDGVATDITENHEQQIKLQQLGRRSEVLLSLPDFDDEYEEHVFMRKVLNCVEKLTGSEIGFMHFINDDQNALGVLL